MPVAGHFVDAPASVRAAGAWISGICVHAEMACQHNGPVIVIKLVREEECPGEAVIFCAVMSVVFVRGNRVTTKAVVLCYICRQAVVMAEKNRLTVTALNQIRRNSAVKGPDGVRSLRGEAGMELQRNGLSRIDAGVKLRSNLRIIAAL